MEHEEVELLPCPFCGGEASIDKKLSWDNWRIRCSSCYVMYENELKSEIIRVWNLRHQNKEKGLALKIGHYLNDLEQDGNITLNNKKLNWLDIGSFISKFGQATTGLDKTAVNK